MRWLVRADASVHIGAGHVMRCLTLAQRARRHGVQVEFLSRDEPGALHELVQAQGFTVHRLGACDDDREAVRALAAAQPVDWLVLDHYRIDAVWERSVRDAVRHILVIDDLANRAHDCNVLVDANYWPDAERRYRGLLPDGCISLLGPRFLLLRDEFVQARRDLHRDTSRVQRVLVNFGGTDEANATLLALQALALLEAGDLALDVVIGETNPNRDSLLAALQGLPDARLHVQTSEMARLIAQADIAIGACGSSTWERCFLGLPTLALVLADNQRLAAEQLDREGVLINLGDVHAVSAQGVAAGLKMLLQDAALRERLSRRGMDMLPDDLQDWTTLLLQPSDATC
jgi:UDP-2,4-diacetamido-2,4,6-trideoxy-beta-L-altropyranose hydrolase